MLNTVLIFIATCIALILLMLKKPTIKIKSIPINTFWIPPLCGAFIMLFTKNVSANDILASFLSDSSVNPFKILILFISMTLISVYLDCVGFFRYLASAILKKAGKSQFVLFCYLYITVSILTIFTSNDIVILTFTPFICYFAKNSKINPIPYLITEFVAANTWSMLLIIGNPTNVYLATSANISFSDYFFKMALPTLMAGIVSFLILFILFKNNLKNPIQTTSQKESLSDKFAVKIGLVHLVGAIIFMIISSYINLPMWIISSIFCISLFVVSASYFTIKKTGLCILAESIKRTPFEIIPFVLSMFIIVLALQNSGVTTFFSNKLTLGNTIFSFGITSFLMSNILNNIPMSVLYSSIINATSSSAYMQALYASIIGSNLGAFFTPLGALAGIMWMSSLKRNNISMTFLKFIKYGFAISVPVLFSSLAVLSLTLN